MPTYVPPKKGAEYIFYIGLVSQSAGNTLQTNPTIAAGDFTVSIDGGASSNLATLPTVTPAGGKRVKVTLSTSEMNGDNVSVVASDVAGAEWADLLVNIQTSARQVDDLAFPNTAGRGIDVTATGAVGIDWSNVENQSSAVNLSATNIDPDQVVASVTGAVGSVTGAVGSVTGNVGGNVVGSVGSVTGNIGGNINGNVVGTVASVVGNLGGNVVGNVNGNVVGSVGSVSGLNPALLDVAVSSRLASAAYTAPDNAGIAANGAAIAALPTAAQNAAAVLTTQMTESYRANGAAPTLAQAQFEVIAHLGESSIVGTTKTINGVDHTTPAETFTLDSATAPTSITRAT